MTDQNIELVRTAIERHAKELKEEKQAAKPKNGKQKAKQKTTEDTVDRLLDRFLSIAPALAGLLILAVGLVDRPQQFVERRGFLHWPGPIERGAKQSQISLREQADGHDALVHGKTLRNLIEPRTRLSC